MILSAIVALKVEGVGHKTRNTGRFEKWRTQLDHGKQGSRHLSPTTIGN